MKTWDIPIGWNVSNTADGASPAKMFGPYQMDFTLSSNGTLRVDKFGHWVSRGLNANPNGPDNGLVVMDDVVYNPVPGAEASSTQNHGGSVIWTY